GRIGLQPQPSAAVHCNRANADAPGTAMPYLILFLLVLAAQPLPWPATPFGWGGRGCLLATALAAAAPVALAAWLAGRTRRRLLAVPAERSQTLRAYHRGRVLHLLILIAVQFAA